MADNKKTSPYAIDVDNVMRATKLGIKPSELELAAALAGNAVDFSRMQREDRFRICEQAAVISELIDATDETRFTLYDMVEGILDDPASLRIEAFPSHETWYEAVLEKAIAQRQKYEK